eukprot:2674970-Lingulodinium_polyedra.AAC.1
MDGPPANGAVRPARHAHEPGAAGLAAGAGRPGGTGRQRGPLAGRNHRVRGPRHGEGHGPLRHDCPR